MTTRRSSDDIAGLGAKWGALWGAVAGLWLLAPRLLESHRLFPASAAQWLTVLAALLIIFGMVGGLLGFFAGFPLAVALAAARRRVQNPRWFYGLMVAPVMSALYLGDSLLGYWLSFGSVPGRDLVWAWLGPALLVVPAAAGFVLAYRFMTAPDNAWTPAWLARTLGLAIAAGAAALPLRLSGAPAVAGGASSSIVCSPPSRPLVLVGIDGATWRVIDPLLQRGDLPNLKKMLDTGTRGDVEALWPPYWSGAAWGAMLTGYGREETGVFEDMAARAPGMPPFQIPLVFDPLLNPLMGVRSLLDATGIVDFTAPPRALLRRQPFWELLDRAGVSTAVVRFRFTYPAESRAGVMVSDWIGHDQWNLLLKADPNVSEGLVAPVEIEQELSAPFSALDPFDETLLRDLLGGPVGNKPADSKAHPVDSLRIASDIDRRTFDVSETILRLRPDTAVLAVYIGGFDTVEHAFWQYRFPEDFPGAEPAATDIAALGSVLDRYMQFVDRRLGRLIAHYSTPPNALIVSDHGHGPELGSAQWRGGHSAQGAAFAAAGPDIPHLVNPLKVSYFDIVPTVLDLAGCSRPSDLTGSPLIAQSASAVDSR